MVIWWTPTSSELEGVDGYNGRQGIVATIMETHTRVMRMMLRRRTRSMAVQMHDWQSTTTRLRARSMAVQRFTWQNWGLTILGLFTHFGGHCFSITAILSRAKAAHYRTSGASSYTKTRGFSVAHLSLQSWLWAGALDVYQVRHWHLCTMICTTYFNIST